MNQRQQVNKREKKTKPKQQNRKKKKKITGLHYSEGGNLKCITTHLCYEGKAVVKPVHLCMDGEEQKKGYMRVSTR